MDQTGSPSENFSKAQGQGIYSDIVPWWPV
jgi:hypothetical protein